MLIIFVVCLIWSSIMLADFLFKSCLVHGYIDFLHRGGVTVKPFQIRVHISRYNWIWPRLAKLFEPFIDRWFQIGYLITLALVPFSIYTLGQTITNFQWPRSDIDSKETDRTDRSAALQPVVPGINLPVQDIGYYLLALTVASCVHEAGHALAAVRSNVRIDGFGLFVFGIVPAAFVELPTELFNCCRIQCRLKIVCAGVWHNLVLAGLCGLLLVGQPIWYSPMYMQSEGVVVAAVDHADIAATPTALKSGDVIIGVDNCFVESKAGWRSCLQEALTRSPTEGYCVQNNFVAQERQLSLVPGRCCGEESRRHLCFKDAGSYPVQAPESPKEQVKKSIGNDDGLCLPVRLLLNSFTGNCNTTKDCMIDEPRCLRPVIEDPRIRLMQLHREDKEAFLFLGHPAELFQSISVIEFKPRLSEWIPVRPLLWIDNLLRYLASFSLALAVLNAVPCFFLDGHWICQCLIEAMFSNRLTIQRRTLITNLICLFGTLLVVTTVALALIQLALIIR